MGLGDAALNLTLSAIHGLLLLRDSLCRLFAWLWTGILYLAQHKGTKLEYIQKDVKHLEKIPMHLALIVAEEEISNEDLARMVVWGFSSGTHYVSVYGHSSKLYVHVENRIVIAWL